jgi:peptidyl-prolyl cis-trans isomerase A (cyclophilin A)
MFHPNGSLRRAEKTPMKRLLVASLFCANLAVAQTPAVGATAQPAATAAKETNVVVVIETSLGNITAELYPDKAPASVSNFLAYADEKFYDGTIFHRVMKGFMIQGGGFTTQMKQKPNKAPIKNEADNGLTNERGTLAMARTMVVDSATSQFFINHGDHNDFLNFKSKTPQGYGYAVFGKVIDGLDVVDKIADVATGNVGPFQNVPLTPVEIKSIHRQAPAAVK